MGRINNTQLYPIKEELKQGDTIIGSDFETGETHQYSREALLQYIQDNLTPVDGGSVNADYYHYRAILIKGQSSQVIPTVLKTDIPEGVTVTYENVTLPNTISNGVRITIDGYDTSKIFIPLFQHDSNGGESDTVTMYRSENTSTSVYVYLVFVLRTESETIDETLRNFPFEFYLYKPVIEIQTQEQDKIKPLF